MPPSGLTQTSRHVRSPLWGEADIQSAPLVKASWELMTRGIEALDHFCGVLPARLFAGTFWPHAAPVQVVGSVWIASTFGKCA
jgi:hypothetical protein